MSTAASVMWPNGNGWVPLAIPIEASLPYNKIRAFAFYACEHTYPIPFLQHNGIHFTIKLQQTSSSRCNSLIPAFFILNQIPQKIFLHRPWLSSAHLPDCVD